MKPDWSDAPEWANWCAMDSDGYWYWFENKPECESEDVMWVDNGGEVQQVIFHDWKQALERRP